MAQVMKYHNYPAQGTGSYSYSHSVYGSLSANFGATTYNWSAMPNDLSSYNDGVATLLYHCGVSVEMDYGPKGFSANVSSDAKNALIMYFRYDSSMYYAERAEYLSSDWINLLKTELNARRPILYRGTGTGGHAFVCDGYKDIEYFHFNWGWSGAMDGYYYLNDLTPQNAYNNLNFTQDQGALIGIKPSSAPTPTCTYAASPETQTFEAAGGSGTITITTASGCAWTSASGAGWITVLSGLSSSGSGAVIYAVEANTSTSSRTGTISVGGKTITISQAGITQPPQPPQPTCTYTISPEAASFPVAGGTGTINVTAPAGCTWEVWQVMPRSPFCLEAVQETAQLPIRYRR